MLYLPGHDCLVNPFLFEEPEHLAELPDPHPRKSIREFFDRRISLFADGSDGNCGAGAASAFKDKKRKLSVSGYETKLHAGLLHDAAFRRLNEVNQFVDFGSVFD